MRLIRKRKRKGANMPCKVDHLDPDNIPSFLCRACHPEMNMTPERKAVLEALERTAREAKRADEQRERELRKAKNELEQLEARDLAPDSTPYKIRESLRRKVGNSATA